MTSTFVVTLQLDRASFDWLNALRQQHFPAERNFLDAHLTLFHSIDSEGIARIERLSLPSRQQDIPLLFAGLRFLGRGIAVDVVAPQLLDLRTRQARSLKQMTAQDQQPFRPHVTIQNKVEPAIARALLTELTAEFQPRRGSGIAILIWEYLGGPWRLTKRLPLHDS